MKPELGYYLTSSPFGEIPVPFYGLRAIPTEIAERLPKGFARQNWQVEIWHTPSREYVWINESRHLIFLH